MKDLAGKSDKELLNDAIVLVLETEPVTFDDIKNGKLSRHGLPMTGSSRDEFMDNCEDLFYIMRALFHGLFKDNFK